SPDVNVLMPYTIGCPSSPKMSAPEKKLLQKLGLPESPGPIVLSNSLPSVPSRKGLNAFGSPSMLNTFDVPVGPSKSAANTSIVGVSSSSENNASDWFKPTRFVVNDALPGMYPLGVPVAP